MTNGITLIALIVTIIVLLILAGMSIALLTGENGILIRATESKEETKREAAREKLNLVLSDIVIEKGRVGESIVLNDELANMIESYKEITSAKFNGEIIISVVDGYKFEVYGDLEVKEAAPDSFSLSKNKIKLIKGKTDNIEIVTTINKEGTINWTVEDDSVATINSTTGKEVTITAVGEEGSTTIVKAKMMVDDKEYEASCEVMVVSKVTEIALENMQVDVGKSKKINVTTEPEDQSKLEDLTYKSNNSDIAIVDENGNVKGITPGKTTITVSGKISTDVSKSCEVTVIGLEAGDYVEYNVTFKDYIRDIKFTSSNGWRVLDPGVLDKETGKYSGVKIIANGNVGRFWCNSNLMDSKIDDGSNTVGKWIANDQQKNKYLSEFGLNESEVEPKSLSIAAGLYYNFDKLEFTPRNTVSYNGVTMSEVNGRTDGHFSGKEFEIPGVSKDAHNLTLAEVRKVIGNPELGLGDSVQQLGKKTKALFAYADNGNVSWTGIMYLLATPLESSEEFDLMGVAGTSVKKLNVSEKVPGIRPVVTIIKNVYKDGDIWKIEQ